MILDAILAVSVLLTSLALAWTGWCLLREARLDVARFAKAFPGRCMVCSYRYYGITHGFVDPTEPVESHHCIEGRG